MARKKPDPNWPKGKPNLNLEYIKEDLRKTKSEMRAMIDQHENDGECGAFDLDWLITHITQRTCLRIQTIARQLPDTIPGPPAFIPAEKELDPSKDFPDFSREELAKYTPTKVYRPLIQPLSNWEWDTVFRGYCGVLDLAVDMFIHGDDAKWQAKLHENKEPHWSYQTTCNSIEWLEKYPWTKEWAKRLLSHMETHTRSGRVWREWWYVHAPPEPTSKLDTLRLDDEGRKRLLKEMEKYPKLKSLLSSPPKYHWQG
ncbi:hypothetical protein F4808DRAFT_413904 [Astrocystis sublimbata]|nr:hypothetical protein F4808DRAFT_413904 [Astrocystis sublimbata]